MKHSEVDVKCRMTPQSIADLFENLAESFRKGKFVLQKESSFVTLVPCGEIDVEMEAAAKKGKFKFEMQLKWREEAPVEESSEPAFIVSCEEPCTDLEPSEPQDASEVQGTQEEILYRKF
ncbi:MAG: amphi-Trp domain-containing protein [Thermodesulfobacteriota bacterium]